MDPSVDNLHSLCVFRKKTIQAVEALAWNPRPDLELLRAIKKGEPLWVSFGNNTILHHEMFPTVFKARLENVLKWVEECRRKILV